MCVYILVGVKCKCDNVHSCMDTCTYKLNDHACINQPLGAKVEFSERREIANAFTIIPIHFQYLKMPITLEWKVQSKN